MSGYDDSIQEVARVWHDRAVGIDGRSINQIVKSRIETTQHVVQLLIWREEFITQGRSQSEVFPQVSTWSFYGRVRGCASGICRRGLAPSPRAGCVAQQKIGKRVGGDVAQKGIGAVGVVVRWICQFALALGRVYGPEANRVLTMNPSGFTLERNAERVVMEIPLLDDSRVGISKIRGRSDPIRRAGIVAAKRGQVPAPCWRAGC